ncbi:GTP cyclohydrolase II [Arthrobacter castelli]|uniref:GTP cyclohydrolase II n=1 Tax=Arthrobacter castelli TaxID=271431 RepID=UPI0004072842|nr:GTP cyclohydrolase II [Arthrobacter castelli]
MTDAHVDVTGVAGLQGGPEVALPTAFGTFRAQAWLDTAAGVEHFSVSAASDTTATPLVRLHSECLTGDVFGSYRCDCGEQLDMALELIQQYGGSLVYLRGHEGRGIGLANKLRAYALQEDGADTVEANEQLGLPVDARNYQAAAAILAELGHHRIRLLSNNPDKESHLLEYGITVEEMVPVQAPARQQNERYLLTKRDRMNHKLSLLTELDQRLSADLEAGTADVEEAR